jgi:thiol-disulfide isomerase/thioredoxin
MMSTRVHNSSLAPAAPTATFEVAGEGKFSYTGAEIDRPMFCKIIFADSGGDASNSLLLGTFVVEPGAKLMFDQYITGTAENDAQAAMSRTMDSLYMASNEGITSDLFEQFTRLQNDFIADNIDNMAGVLQFVKANTTGRGAIAPGANAAEQIAKFSPEMQTVPAVIEIRHSIEDRIEEEAKFGGKYLEIVSISPDGATIKLSEVIAANKLTLIDFWASWCVPCIQELPHLKETYDEYHAEGFEIFGVTLDDTAEAWRGAIAEHGMPWIHVGSLGGWEEPAAAAYGVRSIPASWLVDGEGNIVAKNLRGEELKNRVAEIMAQ